MQLINSCKIEYSKPARTYTISVTMRKSFSRRITFKFDTGATSTMITVNSLFSNKELATKAVLFLNNCFEKEGLQPFKFYFYLVFSTAFPKALLGVDFISCCDCNMLAGQDIELLCFHSSKYSGGYTVSEKGKAIDVRALLQALDTIVLTEDQLRLLNENGQQKFIDSLDSFNDSLDYSAAEEILFYHKNFQAKKLPNLFN